MARNFAACVHIWRETERGPFPGYFFTAYPYPSLSVRCWGKRTPCPPPPRLSTEGASLSHCNTAGPDIRRCAARWPGVEVLPPASRSSASLPQGDGVEVTPSCMQVRASAHLPTGKFFSVADCRGLCTDHYLWLLLVKDKCISIESIRKIYDIQNAFFDELLVEII